MNTPAKCVEVWLTRAEYADPAVQAQLQQLFAECKEKRYLPVVYVSGGEDLSDLTSQLLAYNRMRCMASSAQMDSE